ncbi:ATP-dependent DNA helicase [Lactobacillus ultunensis]|uniref:UvrD-like helicase C-terminal domain-containing protein n=1 Tax=Lactobacillus ultunensis DSM 16047 TaxID=525365 RepID=C2EPM7_9LACO|nr:ATP-dependent RecD-like DNA helicase [Lactobacillus ultunensis]EEJ71499.1 hypothetical protein HMPREF0548_1623 [Lactobacillus ultunensis DSM 16047]KRL79797.1 helicase [Lactobacillus ultunensis DSM 16047]
MEQYHDSIASVISETKPSKITIHRKFTIKDVIPFFVNNELYFQITYYPSYSNGDNSDRQIAFTKLNIFTKYTVELSISKTKIKVDNTSIPIAVITNWRTSITPGTYNNMIKIFKGGIGREISNAEANTWNMYLTQNRLSFSDLCLVYNDDKFQNVLLTITKESGTICIFSKILNEARKLVRDTNFSNRNTLLYLLSTMNKNVISDQYDPKFNEKAHLYISPKCYAFERHPYYCYLIHHKPAFRDILTARILPGDYIGDILARIIRTNIQNNILVFIPVDQIRDEVNTNYFLNQYLNISTDDKLKYLMDKYNAKSLPKNRIVLTPSKYITINQYLNESKEIISKFKKIASYTTNLTSREINNLEHVLKSKNQYSSDKIKIISELFKNTSVGVIYGAAGTGKSTFTNLVASWLKDETKLFLSSTNTAVENLRKRVNHTNAQFSTVAKYLYPIKKNAEIINNYDLLVIDECSSISNADILQVISHTNAKKILLVGDPSQLYSIDFGNWFALLPFYLKDCCYTLSTQNRNKSKDLEILWNNLRNLDNFKKISSGNRDRIPEGLAINEVSRDLNSNVFNNFQTGEIILCLNYDGLYGINNLNTCLQLNNKHDAVKWNDHVYKIGDPVLFNETQCFHNYIYNNMQGIIENVEKDENTITFTIKMTDKITSTNNEFKILRQDPYTEIQISVNKPNKDEGDDENSIVPFHIAYAISIHKSQGLEYQTVKLVIPPEQADQIDLHNFYTAVTRSKSNLFIYWSEETERKVINHFTNTNEQPKLKSDYEKICHYRPSN